MLKIGHRGAPGYPRRGENTKKSFLKAIWKGANALEFDVRRCKSGELVVIHDARVDRTTNGSGCVKDLTYSELSVLDAGFGDRIPKLADILRAVGSHALLNIEIKEEGLARDILNLIGELGFGPFRIIVSAFASDDNDDESSSSWNQLEIFAGRVQIALLATERKICHMGWKEYLNEAVSRGAFAVHPPADAVTRDMVGFARDRDLLVNVWTENRPKKVKYLRDDVGVDGIFSDFPEIM